MNEKENKRKIIYKELSQDIGFNTEYAGKLTFEIIALIKEKIEEQGLKDRAARNFVINMVVNLVGNACVDNGKSEQESVELVEASIDLLIGWHNWYIERLNAKVKCND